VSNSKWPQAFFPHFRSSFHTYDPLSFTRRRRLNVKEFLMKVTTLFTNSRRGIQARRSRTFLALGLVASLLCYTHVRRVSAADSSMVANHRGRISSSGQPDQSAQAHINGAIGKLPLSFEANQGQVDRRVKFFSRDSGHSLFLTSSEAVLSLHKPAAHTPKQQISEKTTTVVSKGEAENEATALRMKLIGAHSNPRVIGLDELPGKNNYFSGSDPKKWRTNVPNFGRVQYRSVYPGIDLVFYSSQQQLEYDFIVSAGANPRRIRLEFGGAENISVDARGDLVLRTKDGEIRHHKPLCYQEANGARREVSGGYVLKGKNQVSFQVGEYDASRSLVIDPAIVYSSYLGGSNDGSRANGITVYTDTATGRVYAYVTGRTWAPDFPTKNAIQPTNHLDSDAHMEAFVTKLDMSASGNNSVVYSTYLGGSGNDGANGIAVDPSGNAYIAGRTESYADFPLVNAPTQGRGGAFVTELNAIGTAIVYSMSFGGDSAQAIAVDASGNAYVTGWAEGGVPVTANAYQSVFIGNSNAFVSKIAPPSSSNPASFVYSTYLGTDECKGSGIAVDSSGNIYITGTARYGLPVVSGFQTFTRNGKTGNPFMAKLDPSASGVASLVYSTYLGGTGNGNGDGDEGWAIAADSAGNAYITGTSKSTDFPTTPGAFRTSGNGGLYVARINPTLVSAASLVYSTYLGGVGPDSGGHVDAITVDSAGNAYVAGANSSPDFPLVNPLRSLNAGVFQSINGGNTFTGLNKGLTNPYVTALALDTSTVPRTLYAGTLGGIFKSTDGGSNWNPTNVGITNPEIKCLVINPTNSSALYAGTSDSVFKSIDGGNSWSPFNTGLSSAALTSINALVFDTNVVNGVPTATLYGGTGDGLYKMTDGSSGWSTAGLTAFVRSVSVDPNPSPHTIYTGSECCVAYKSIEGGKDWTEISPTGSYFTVGIDSTTMPSTLYAMDYYGGPLIKSTDDGSSWASLAASSGIVSGDLRAAIAFDTNASPSTVYASDFYSGVFRSTDEGVNWTQIFAAGVGSVTIDPGSIAASPLYVGTGMPSNDVFVAELNPTGTALVFSTYLGGNYDDGAAGIALDSSGNIYVAGITASSDFPVANAFQATLPGYQSTQAQVATFVVKLGSAALPSTSSGSVTTQMAVQTGTLELSFPNITGSTTGTAPTATVNPLDSTTTANLTLSNNLGAYDIKTTATYNTSGYATDPTKGIKLTFSVPTVNDPVIFNGLVITHAEDMNGDGIIQANEIIPYNASINPNKITYHDFASRTVWVYVPSLSPFVITKAAGRRSRKLWRRRVSFDSSFWTRFERPGNRSRYDRDGRVLSSARGAC
jgi:photosystem II stability/assembly factor-like uncharacterized protein